MSSKMADCMADCLMNCIMECLCCMCCRKLDFIEPKIIEYDADYADYDPDYIPLYSEITGGEAEHKYTNMAP